MAASKTSTIPEPPPRRASILLVCVLLGVSVLAVYLPTLQFEFVNYDDDTYVYDNPVVAKGMTAEGVKWAFTQVHSHNWHPLTSLSHMLDVHFYGMNPRGHHLTNVVLHMATVMALFLVLYAMTHPSPGLRRADGEKAEEDRFWCCAFVAAVFAVHPLRAESVAWVSERKDVLSGLLFMLTLGAYLRYVRLPFSIVRYGAVVLCFVLGLMAKPMLVTLPFLLLVLDYWPLNRFGSGATAASDSARSLRFLIAEKVPLVLVSVASCAVTIWAQGRAVMQEEVVSLPWRLANALSAYVIYVRQTFFPTDLAVYYPHPGTTLPAWQIVGCFVFLAGVLLVVFLLRKKRPYLMTGWLWYLGLLVPVIGILQVGLQAHADRYTYLPQIGLVWMVSWLVADLSSRWRAVLGTVAACILVALIIGGRAQVSHWRDSRSLWEQALVATKGNKIAHNNLGELFEAQNNIAAAAKHYRQALVIDPKFVEGHINLGCIFQHQGDIEGALRHFSLALQIRPDSTMARYNLGTALLDQGKIDPAIGYLQEVVRISPEHAQAHNNLGKAFGMKGEIDQAIEHFKHAVHLAPDFAEGHYNLGMAFRMKGWHAKEIEQYRRALQIEPNFERARYYLDAALRKQREINGMQ